MRTRNRRTATTTPLPSTSTAPAWCGGCASDADHCHGTLVLHADGSAECDEAHICDAREDRHEWWVPCTDLLCGCTGDEHPGSQLLLAA